MGQKNIFKIQFRPVIRTEILWIPIGRNRFGKNAKKSGEDFGR